MDFELRRATEKLEKEQRDRKQRAKLKLDRERKVKQEAARQREAIEATQRQRRLDAAEAESKANQLAEESSLAGRGVMFSRILEAVPYQGIGDKIKLPPSCFTELSDQGAFDKGPLHFSLSLIHPEGAMHVDGGDEGTSRITHAGVLEFTVEEGFVALPQHCWSNLFPDEAPGSAAVEVRYVWLPKGTYAKLQSVEFGFSDIPNHKAVLETSLRQHATLSQGDLLIVNHGALTYHLRVLELKPSPSVSVLETDIEVDIIGPESVDNSNQYILRPLALGKSEQGVVEEGKYMYYKFSLDGETWERISSKDANIIVNLETHTQDGDTDLYVSRHPLLFPTQHQHMWSSHDLGSKALLLGSEDQNLGVGTYTIAVYGYKGKSKYEVSVNVQDVATQRVGQHAASSTSSGEVDTAECRNCKRHIPSRTISLHEAYCSRHNTSCQHPGCGVVLRIEDSERHVHCEKCSKAFQREEIEKHMKVFHEPLHCPCGIVLEKEEMVQHQSSTCSLRLITCRFCGDMVQAGRSADDARDRIRGLSEHESVCGSRTAPCDSCGRSVMLKDMDIHQIAVHQKN
ncbi:hypothetical protein SASPL_154008 [Salvia splendens]|uniref:Ubiquitin fusion degradation protein 1 n=1 Tax=Salvia splendens TaxID=180675 RepID=A0A8X8VZC5_SALSN|nr:uncharacterized protein LOC121787516 [Salvia splendens]KAG6385180.1 hypothetical protein SASPL_154008 [Salvia splendens]